MCNVSNKLGTLYRSIDMDVESLLRHTKCFSTALEHHLDIVVSVRILKPLAVVIIKFMDI